MVQPVVSETWVALPVAEAFARFVDDLGRWWPMSYSWSGARFETAWIDHHAGGQWFESATDGQVLPWGEVRAFEVGERLVLSFNIAADRSAEPPERQSELEITFSPEGEGARIRIEHRDLDKHGDGAALIAQAMASDMGWPLILASFERETRRAR